MTPHELAEREDVRDLRDNRAETAGEQRLSTADLASAVNRADETRPANAQDAPEPAHDEPLFVRDMADNFRQRWEKIQIGFVDEPRQSVEKADELVAAVIKQLAETFAAERNKLEKEWDRGDNVSTEDLRVALRRYRTFFDRLLTI